VADVTEQQSLYVRDGDAFVGTSCTKNAWHENAQSGGAVLALLGHVLEDVPSLSRMSLTRLTVDLVRPVPIGEPLWIDHQISREGKLIQVVDSVVRSEGTELVRSRALRIREADLSAGPCPPSTADDADLVTGLPAPEELLDVADQPGVAGFLVTGAELRRTAGEGTGPHCAWVRLRVPVVAGEAIRATSRLTMPMDCVNLIGVAGLPAGITAINPDVSAHVVRPPVGEWVALVGDTRFAHGIGHGFSAAHLVDAHGVFGVTSTSQVVQRHT
jgi:hypothetical protein